MAESTLHKSAKKILYESRKINVPSLFAHIDHNNSIQLSPQFEQYIIPNSLSKDGMHYNIFNGGYLDAIEVVIEKRVEGKFQPDIIYYCEQINLGIEIKVTNQVTTSRIQKYQEFDFPVLEIDLSSFPMNYINKVNLTKDLIDGLSNKRWININNIKQRYQKILEEQNRNERYNKLGPTAFQLFIEYLKTGDPEIKKEFIKIRDYVKRPIVTGGDNLFDYLVEGCPITNPEKRGRDIPLSKCIDCKYFLNKGDNVTYITCGKTIVEYGLDSDND